MYQVLLAVVLAASAVRELPVEQGWELTGDTAVRAIDGTPALALGQGRAFRRDVRLEDGTVEMDVKLTRRRSFVYVSFRMESDGEHEELYLRPHKSGLPDALQYAPVRQGRSAWQLHHGPGATAAAVFEPGAWTHLRLIVRGRLAALFLGTETKPALVARLQREPRAGYLALRAFDPAPGAGPVAWYRRIRVSPEAPDLDPAWLPAAPAELPGTIRAWAVSEAIPSVDEPGLAPPPAQGFRAVQAEAGGLVSLLRHVAVPERAETWETAARLHVTSERAVPRRLDLGFSDAATVYLNGRALFHADARYSYDQPRQEGLIHLGQASLFLPLKAGDNELLVVVEDRFGGWGLVGRLPDQEGLRVEAR